jgi:hypothetical protein
MHGFFLYSDRTTVHCKKTSAFHQEFHQPELMAKDQTIRLTKINVFSSARMFGPAQTGGFFNSVGT